mgnify:CR=1 FL=1
MDKHEADKNMSESMISEDASCVSLFLGLPNSKMKTKTIMLTLKRIRIDFLLEMIFPKSEYKNTIHVDTHKTCFGTLPSK